MDPTGTRLPWIGSLVAGALLAVGFLLPSAWLMTADGWTPEPSSVPAFAGPYVFGVVVVGAALAVLAAKGRLRVVALWVAIALAVVATLSVVLFESLLLLDCLEHDGRSPDIVRATTARVAAVLVIAWPSFFFMLALLIRGGRPEALYARVLALSGAVLVTWFACLHMSEKVGYGVWTSLLASAALSGFGALAWKQYSVRRA